MLLKDPIWDDDDQTISIRLEEGDEIPQEYNIVEADN